MLYLGHFSFADDVMTAKGEPWHGAFTYVVEARSLEAALTKLARLVRTLVKRHDVFDGTSEIYLDSCVELRSVPRGGVMSYVSLRAGEDVGGISAALLGAAPSAATAYSWGRDENAEAAGELAPVEPFIRLRRSTPRRKRGSPPTEGSRHTKDTIH